MPATGASSTGWVTVCMVPSCSELTHFTSGNSRTTCRKLRRMPTKATKKIRLLMKGLAQKNVMIWPLMMTPTKATRIRKITILMR